MKRVTYKKIGDNMFQSREHINIKDNKVVTVIFDATRKSFAILDVRSNDVLVNDTGTSLHKIKKKIKSSLITLGATFGVEKRYASLQEE
jgi:hypothetical protein